VKIGLEVKIFSPRRSRAAPRAEPREWQETPDEEIERLPESCRNGHKGGGRPERKPFSLRVNAARSGGESDVDAVVDINASVGRAARMVVAPIGARWSDSLPHKSFFGN